MGNAYKKIEMVGTSATSVTDAIESAISRASQTVREIKWFEVDEIRGRVEGGKVAEYQVGLKLGFVIGNAE